MMEEEETECFFVFLQAKYNKHSWQQTAFVCIFVPFDAIDPSHDNLPFEIVSLKFESWIES